MSRLTSQRRTVFARGMLSAFRIHSNQYFLDWMKEFNSDSDIEKMRQDLERVGSDMQNAIDEQAPQSTVVR